MTPDSALQWTLVAAISLCILLGLAIVLVSLRDGWRKIAGWTILYGFLGLIFLTTPKWTTLTFEFRGLKAQIARLESEKGSLNAENAKLVKQSVQLASAVASFQSVSAGLNALTPQTPASDAIATLGMATKDLGWAAWAAPATQVNFAVTTTDEELRNAVPGTTPEAVDFLKQIHDAGFVVIRKATPATLTKKSTKDLWVAPLPSSK